MCPRLQLVSIEYLWDSLGRMVPWHCPRPPKQLQVIAVLQLVWNTILLFAVQDPISPWWEDVRYVSQQWICAEYKPFLSYAPMTVCNMERNCSAFILARVSVMICFSVNVAGCLQNGCWVSLKKKWKFGVREVICDVAKYLPLRTCMFTYSGLDCAQTPNITCCLCEQVIMLQSGCVKWNNLLYRDANLKRWKERG